MSTLKLRQISLYNRLLPGRDTVTLGQKVRFTFLFSVLMVLLIAQQQQLVQIPGSGRVASAVPDALHGSWFACVTWLILLLVGRRTRPGAAIALTALLGVVVAIGTELLQKLSGGDAEVGDVFFDMVGMGAALCVWSARERLVAPRVGIPMAAVLVLGSLWPVIPPILIDRYRDRIAPELVRFDSAYTQDLISSNSVAQIVSAPDGWTIVGPVLKVTLADHTWPGVHLDDPISDWRRYAELEVDVFVDGSAPMPITISVRLDQAPVDQVYRAFDCAPGPCHLRLPFTDLFDRSVARVNTVVIYSRRAQAGRVFYLGRVGLRE